MLMPRTVLASFMFTIGTVVCAACAGVVPAGVGACALIGAVFVLAYCIKSDLRRWLDF